MKSLGFLEVEGLSTAIVAADKMLKTADVELQTVENTKGSGWITINVTGDVAAVEVAVETAKAEIGPKAVSSTVIARPADGISDLGKSDAILGDGVKAPAKPKAKTDNTVSASPAPAKEAPKVESKAPVTKVEPTKPVTETKDETETSKPKPATKAKPAAKKTTSKAKPATKAKKSTKKPNNKKK